jgi:hypothetical protein
VNASNRHDQPTANTPDGVLQLRVVVLPAGINRLVEGGAEPVGSPTETPWRSQDARLDAPGPIHLTLFQELDAGGAQP